LLYVYERAPHGTYVFKQALATPDVASGDLLALQPNALSMTETHLVAGASNADDYSDTSNRKFSHGRAYLWSYKALPNADGDVVTQWQWENTLEVPSVESESYDYFGTAVHV
jgi:hypothetical protein